MIKRWYHSKKIIICLLTLLLLLGGGLYVIANGIILTLTLPYFGQSKFDQLTWSQSGGSNLYFVVTKEGDDFRVSTAHTISNRNIEFMLKHNSDNRQKHEYYQGVQTVFAHPKTFHIDIKRQYMATGSWFSLTLCDTQDPKKKCIDLNNNNIQHLEKLTHHIRELAKSRSFP